MEEIKTTRIPADQIQPCTVCQGSINPVHFHVTIESRAIKPDSARQAMALVGLMNGSVGLASAFGAEVEVGTIETYTAVVCTNCLIKADLLMLMGLGGKNG